MKLKLPATLDLKNWQLRYCAFLLGLPSTGNKTRLQGALLDRLQQPDAVPKAKTERIISVDMGIRNLAYCVLDVSHASSPSVGRSSTLKVHAWKRMDLLESHLDPPGVIESSVFEDQGTGSQLKQTRKSIVPSLIAKAAFAPSSLSKSAYDVTAALLKHKPTTILIERQRFRSGGAAAIQEWTVRVNMLESMLWACLETLRHGKGSKQSIFPSTHEVSPARVAKFWTADPSIPLRPPDSFYSLQMSVEQDVNMAKKKVEKKEKIAIARSWLEGTNDDVALEFEGEAAKTADLFRAGASTKSKSKSGVGKGRNELKLDDLADCLLQAVAWLRWRENAEKMRDMFG